MTKDEFRRFISFLLGLRIYLSDKELTINYKNMLNNARTRAGCLNGDLPGFYGMVGICLNGDVLGFYGMYGDLSEWGCTGIDGLRGFV